MGAALPDSGITADGQRGRFGVEAPDHGEIQVQFFEDTASVALRVGGERHDLNAELFELGLVPGEVSQLLTAVASPFAPVEEQDRHAADIAVVGFLLLVSGRKMLIAPG